MTAPLGRGRARIVTIVAGTAFAAAGVLVAGGASAQPPLPPLPAPGGPSVTCVLDGPGDTHVVIQRRPGQELAVPATPLPPGVALPDCPDIDPSGPVIVGPGGPQVMIGPGGPGVVHVHPAHPAPTGSSGS
ncbi:hypothetical protein OG563_28040 [Nocardia vinacea]|uniref:Uncharacterized protein n=1 Tax=Nocardia vinacea TaxID=96468 RepID=A0ABZ1YJ60_9NOCA|nr:hypothetical protein [Nocardia vinacea]